LIPKEQKSDSDLVIDEDEMDDEEKDFLKKYFQTQINSSGLRRSTTNLQMGGEKPFTASELQSEAVRRMTTQVKMA
jgi:hypothetical protein